MILELPKECQPISMYSFISYVAAMVCYADKFHSKEPEFCTFEKQKEKLEVYDSINGVKLDIFRNKFGVPDVTNIKEEYKLWHIEMQCFVKRLLR